ncbi:hypothetical protein HPB50_005429 [Hyalomma asiaticum]|uniref:Uncharacterized protein n=1 Tax=Hyalomma asiaticum TaxID=266040 RepID=A0ACB7S9A2_HYAAI|nr:hypothetical protein HPB50_005429 [Hyalomma asiaticum]
MSASKSNGAVQKRRVVQLRLRSQFSDTKVLFQAIEIPHICQDIEGSTTSLLFVVKIQKPGKDMADEQLYESVVAEASISVLSRF